MQFADRQRLVNLGAGTFPLAGMMADPAADPWERVLVLEELERLLVTAVIDQGDEALNGDVGRAGGLTGGGTSLGDAVAAGDRLGVLLVDRFAEVEFFVVIVWT